MARSAVERLTVDFVELSPAGLLDAIVNVDTAIKAAAANVFAKVFIMSLYYSLLVLSYKLHQPHIHQLKP
ncbi:hypothetical protein D3C71_1677500 [compost metagenome]